MISNHPRKIPEKEVEKEHHDERVEFPLDGSEESHYRKSDAYEKVFNLFNHISLLIKYKAKI